MQNNFCKTWFPNKREFSTSVYYKPVEVGFTEILRVDYQAFNFGAFLALADSWFQVYSRWTKFTHRINFF